MQAEHGGTVDINQRIDLGLRCRLLQCLQCRRPPAGIGAAPHSTRLREPRITQPVASARFRHEGALQRGIGWVEGWRGDVFVALETGPDGRIVRLHPRDPSWHNWPLLEHAILGNIVPDFPLINKSFNLSYAGQDL